MQTLDLYRVFLFLAVAMLGSGATALAESDVALNLYGAFHGTTNGNGTQQSPSNSAGGLIELRHIANPLIGYEATYSYNRDNQTYKPFCPSGSSGCSSVLPQSVKANAHEVTGDWVVSLHGANLRPFALAGIGILFNQPAGSQTNTSSSTKPVFVYGAGIDWGVLPHLGLRFQYRGNLYKAPNLSRLFTSTDAFTHTSEPMIGAYLHF